MSPSGNYSALAIVWLLAIEISVLDMKVLSLVQTSNFSFAEPNVNAPSSLFEPYITVCMLSYTRIVCRHR